MHTCQRLPGTLHSTYTNKHQPVPALKACDRLSAAVLHRSTPVLLPDTCCTALFSHCACQLGSTEGPGPLSSSLRPPLMIMASPLGTFASRQLLHPVVLHLSRATVVQTFWPHSSTVTLLCLS